METVNTKLGFFDQLIYSVQPSKYKALAAQSKIRTAIFVVMIAVFLTIMSYVIPVSAFLTSVKGIDNFIMEVLPDIELKGGKLDVSHKLEMGADTLTHLLVDTSIEKVTEKDFDQESYMMEVIVGKENALIYYDSIGFAEFSFTQLNEVNLDNKGLLEMKPAIEAFMVMYFFSNIIAYLINYIFSALFLALLCWGPFTVRGTERLKYSKILALTFYAKAVPQLIMTFNSTAELIPGQSLLMYASVIATVFILMSGIRGLQEKKA